MASCCLFGVALLLWLFGNVISDSVLWVGVVCAIVGVFVSGFRVVYYDLRGG